MTNPVSPPVVAAAGVASTKTVTCGDTATAASSSLSLLVPPRASWHILANASALRVARDDRSGSSGSWSPNMVERGVDASRYPKDFAVEPQPGVVQVGLGRAIPLTKPLLFTAPGEPPLLGPLAVDPRHIQPRRCRQHFGFTGVGFGGEASHRHRAVKGQLAVGVGLFHHRKRFETLRRCGQRLGRIRGKHPTGRSPTHPGCGTHQRGGFGDDPPHRARRHGGCVVSRSGTRPRPETRRADRRSNR